MTLGSTGRNVTLVLGASSDIGCELARRLCAQGHNVAGHCKTGAARLSAMKLSAEQLSIFPADLSDPADTTHLIADIRKQYGVPDFIVFLASPKLKMIRFSEVSQSDFDEQEAVQNRALMMILQAFLPDFAKRRKGKVVLLLSSCVLSATPGSMAHYVTAKYAALGLMRAAAAEYASRGVQINAVSPAMVETAFLDQVPPRIVEMARDRHPLKRLATVNDVVQAILFLLSDGSDYMTGVNIPITGEVC